MAYGCKTSSILKIKNKNGRVYKHRFSLVHSDYRKEIPKAIGRSEWKEEQIAYIQNGRAKYNIKGELIND